MEDGTSGAPWPPAATSALRKSSTTRTPGARASARRRRSARSALLGAVQDGLAVKAHEVERRWRDAARRRPAPHRRRHDASVTARSAAGSPGLLFRARRPYGRRARGLIIGTVSTGPKPRRSRRRSRSRRRRRRRPRCRSSGRGRDARASARRPSSWAGPLRRGRAPCYTRGPRPSASGEQHDGLQSDFLRVVHERGYVHQCTRLGAARRAAAWARARPISASMHGRRLHVGHLSAIMLLRWLQDRPPADRADGRRHHQGRRSLGQRRERASC